MLNIEAEIALPEPEIGLILTYCASLAHFEQELLSTLTAGVRGVDLGVVMDHQQYQETFVEAAGLLRTGVDYQVWPARLPAAGAAFHPKLYVVLSGEQARMIVTSANLTVFGLRANAEVGAVLDLGPTNRAHSQLFSDLSAFLLEMPDIVDLGGAAPLVRQVGERLRRMLNGESSGGQARLIHNLSRPILDQLLEIVPSTDVTEVDVVSPYFDKRGAALRRLADSFPEAAIRVFTDREASGTLDGAAVAAWPQPPELHLIDGFAGSGCSVHAKLIRLKGPNLVWSLVGSPNASTPGLLRAVTGEGNLEVALLAPEELQSGLAPLETELGEWESLEYADRNGDGATDNFGKEEPLLIGRAELSDGQVSVEVAGPFVTGLSDWKARLALRRGDMELTLEGEFVDGRYDLTGRISGRDPPEEPVVIHVEARAPRGMRRGRAWLSRPTFLKRTTWERRGHQLAATIEGRGALSDAESNALGDILIQVLAEACAPQAQPSPQAELGRDEETGGDRTIPREQKVFVPDLVSRDYSATRVPVSTARQRREVIARLLGAFRTSAVPLSEDEESDAWSDEDDPDQAGDGRRTRSSPLKASTVRSLTESFRDLIVRWSAASTAASDVTDVAHVIETTCRALLRYEIRLLRSRESGAQAKVLNDLLIEALRSTFSLDGIHRGWPAGWFVRAWADEQARSDLDVISRAPGAREGYLALLGAAMVRGKAGGTSRGDETWRLIRAGIDLVTGTGLVSDQDLALETDQLESGDEQLQQEEALIAIELSSEVPAILTTARWWAPLISNDGRWEMPADAPVGLHRLRNRLIANPAIRLSPIAADEGVVYCSDCRVAIARGEVQHLAEPGRMAACENCGAMLVPFDYRSALARPILRELVPGFGGREA